VERLTTLEFGSRSPSLKLRDPILVEWGVDCHLSEEFFGVGFTNGEMDCPPLRVAQDIRSMKSLRAHCHSSLAHPRFGGTGTVRGLPDLDLEAHYNPVCIIVSNCKYKLAKLVGFPESPCALGR
jgi:hypothetical protein